MSNLQTFSRRKRRNRYNLKKLAGGKMRLCVFRSNKQIYAQIIDDTKGVTIVSASSFDKELANTKGGACSGALEVGKLIAKRAKDKGVETVVFDRGGYLYHGRVKALADGAREAGLVF